jgi:hypothetical protein
MRMTTTTTNRLLLDILRILNLKSGGVEIIREILNYVKKTTGVEAAAIRLVNGDDYPYFSTEGFPDSFVKAENFLCARDMNNRIVRDAEGNPVHECMCGNIIHGRLDPYLPFFTAGGSFWSNNTTKLLAETTEEDRQAHTRNRCNGLGYESVALIPIRTDPENIPIGLLQLNDREKDKFSMELIEALEEACCHLGVAIIRCKIEEDNREKIKLQSIIEMAGAVCHNFNQPLQVCLGNSNLLTSGMIKAGDKKFWKCIEKIEQSVNKMGELSLKFQSLISYKTMNYVNGTRIIDIDKASRREKSANGYSCTGGR